MSVVTANCPKCDPKVALAGRGQASSRVADITDDQATSYWTSHVRVPLVKE